MIDIKNPELLRYVRSELRPARVATIIGGALFGSFLLAMVIYLKSSQNPFTPFDWRDYWRDVYSAIFVVSGIVLVLWTLLNTSQAVVGERTHRTFDFWRTTRLSPLTLAVGKLIGAPIGAWLQFAIVLPLLLFTGLLGGYRVTTIIGSFLVLALFNLALGSLALCFSMRAHDARRSTMLMLLIALSLLPNVSFGAGGSRDGMSLFSAWSALNPISGIGAWHNGYVLRVMLFGRSVPSLLLSVCLSLVVIAWCMVALVRSIKLEPEQRSLFSPLQVVGVSASILLFSYASFRPTYFEYTTGSLDQLGGSRWALGTLIAGGVAVTLLCLYFNLVSTLFSRDKLRHELRSRSSKQIAARLITPWVATGIIGLFAAVLALVGYRHAYEGVAVPWSGLLGMFLAITVYAIRDGMFLQWMISQRVKLPVLKGMVVLVCYYLGTT